MSLECEVTKTLKSEIANRFKPLRKLETNHEDASLVINYYGHTTMCLNNMMNNSDRYEFSVQAIVMRNFLGRNRPPNSACCLDFTLSFASSS